MSGSGSSCNICLNSRVDGVTKRKQSVFFPPLFENVAPLNEKSSSGGGGRDVGENLSNFSRDETWNINREEDFGPFRQTEFLTDPPHQGLGTTGTTYTIHYPTLSFPPHTYVFYPAAATRNIIMGVAVATDSEQMPQLRRISAGTTALSK